MHTKTFLLGAAAGAAAVYLFDPDRGQARREELTTRAREAAESPTGQKVVGQVVESTRQVHDRGPDSDPALANKVRSEVLGKDEYQALSINVDAVDGVVSLRGTVEDLALRNRLVSDVEAVGGVDSVENHLG